MPFGLSVTYDSISRTARGLRAAAQQLLSTDAMAAAETQILVRAIQQKAPKKTGRGAASFHAVGTKIYALQYMLYVDEGTRPHPIVPTKARALRFEVNGQTVFAKRVQHPGIKARHYIQAAIDESKPQLLAVLAETGQVVFQTIRNGG